jgi:hypothetical protein
LQRDIELLHIGITRPFDEWQGNEIPVELVRVHPTKEQYACSALVIVEPDAECRRFDISLLDEKNGKIVVLRA